MNLIFRVQVAINEAFGCDLLGYFFIESRCDQETEACAPPPMEGGVKIIQAACDGGSDGERKQGNLFSGFHFFPFSLVVGSRSVA